MLDETYLFKGDENSLIMTQSYTHKFQCDYQLERYPFDTQVSKTRNISFISGLLHCNERKEWRQTECQSSSTRLDDGAVTRNDAFRYH